MKKGIVLLLILLLVSSFAFAQGTKETAGSADAPLKVGVIYISPPGDMGYSYMHDQGTPHSSPFRSISRMNYIAPNFSGLGVPS